MNKSVNDVGQSTGQVLDAAGSEIHQFLVSPNPFRSILLLAGAVLVAFWLSRYLARFIIHIAQYVATRSENESNEAKAQTLREVETYLSVTVAAVRAVVISVTAYIIWKILSPSANSSVAAIGASAFFIVFAGQSLGMLIRDVTSGAAMIIEKWFTIGDFIKVEPFMDVSGVVERMTLRSTKLRSLSGEVVWISNQQIQAAHVSPRGVRTIAVDVFVRDRVAGERAIEHIIGTIPTGPTMLAGPLKVTVIERWNDEMWRISVVGQTMPGREWLIENHFVNMVCDIDESTKDKSEKLILYKPIARFSDPVTERKVRRAVRVANERQQNEERSL